MTTRLKEVDAVMVGMGWTGSILARELTKAGLNVVGLERGIDVRPEDNFAIPSVRDDFRYFRQLELIQDPATETLTLRHKGSEEALPFRRFGAFLPGSGTGGAGNHWGGQFWRYTPTDHALRSRLAARYGAKSIPEDMTVEDWTVSYDELEPYYDRFDKLCGVSGKAGNLQGRIIAGGNPFEGPRSSEYPNPPVTPTLAALTFAEAARSLGYHPFPQPVANASRPYTNSEGLTLGACQYCGFCERTGCEFNAKASSHVTLMPILRADPRFTLRTNAWVSRLDYDKAARKVRGVVYTDTRTGEEYEQPASLVVLSSYTFSNTLLLLLSGIGEPYDPASGKGSVGKNYAYQSGARVTVFFDDKEFNPFMGSPGTSMVIDDFNADNFDHSGLGFFGGASIQGGNNGGLPTSQRPVPPGVRRWGTHWKAETARWYRRSFGFGAQGTGYANRAHYLDLDPNYRDALGRPLLRMTWNYDENDRKRVAYLIEAMTKLGRAMNPTAMIPPRPLPEYFDATIYGGTHNTGGTIMGKDPATSTVNRYLQAWSADNLFVVGGSVMPQQTGYNPTGAIGALAYWSADAITTRYLKSPGPLI